MPKTPSLISENSDCSTEKYRHLLLTALLMSVGCAGASAGSANPAPQAGSAESINESEDSKAGESKSGKDEDSGKNKKKKIRKKGNSYSPKPWFLRTPTEERERRERIEQWQEIAKDHRMRMLNKA